MPSRNRRPQQLALSRPSHSPCSPPHTDRCRSHWMDRPLWSPTALLYPTVEWGYRRAPTTMSRRIPRSVLNKQRRISEIVRARVIVLSGMRVKLVSSVQNSHARIYNTAIKPHHSFAGCNNIKTITHVGELLVQLNQNNTITKLFSSIFLWPYSQLTYALYKQFF